MLLTGNRIPYYRAMPSKRGSVSLTHRRRAVVIGLPYYAKRLAKLMNEYSDHWEMRAFEGHRWDTLRTFLEMRKVDALICFGCLAPNAALTALARRYGVEIVVAWAGSDVIKAQENPQDLQVIKQEGFHHIADGPWLIEELAVLGLNVEYEPLTDVWPGDPVQNFPHEFRVLTHLPRQRPNFYGASRVYEIARRMPGVQFVVVGSAKRTAEAPPNVQFCGYVTDVMARIDKSVVVLRLPKHDGKSMLVLEALARARHVVWNYEFPHVFYANCVDDVVEKLESLRALHAAGRLALNTKGREYVLEHFVREKIAERFEARLDRIMANAKFVPPAARVVAVSGLSMFCADIAAYARSIAPAWDVRLMRTNSRLGLLTAIVSISRSHVWYTIGNPGTDRWLPLAARLMRKPRVVHWVGSDILILAEHPALCSKLRDEKILHLAETTWTARELAEFGLAARIVPLPPRHHYGVTCPLPAKFSVMLYVPRTRLEFYGSRAFERFMSDHRDLPIRYAIVGGGTLAIPDGVDAVNLGWRNDLREAYHNITALVRFTPHDGLSLMVLEALSYGRHVIWTQPFEFVRQVKDYEHLEQELLRLVELHERGELRPQEDASHFIRQQYSPQACVTALSRAWEDAAFMRRALYSANSDRAGSATLR